jgi:5-methyltetrahydropteroyltriglutamate--homocysteine methyltransferase
MSTDIIRTAVVGSYPQPDWLIDRALLTKLMAPRVRAEQIWRIPSEQLGEAQDDATIVAIHEQERAGIDIISDGEIRRESYSNLFANALEGIDRTRRGEIIGRTGARMPVPLVTGPIRRKGPIGTRDVEFLRRHSRRTIKVTLPGPFTLSQQAVDEYYRDPGALALAYGEVVNEEIRDLFTAGADIVQLDEPWLQARADAAHEFGIAAINRALEGVTGVTALHLCFGYAALVKSKPVSGYAFLSELAATPVHQISIEAAQPRLDLAVLEDLPGKTWMIGVLDLADPNVEAASIVAGRIRSALEHVPPDRLIATPDCGMKYLPRRTAFDKLRALAEGARIVNNK